MSHVFISYARKDRRIVGQFVEELRKKDFIIWQDISDLAVGENWRQAILDAVEQSSVVIVFWTQAASLSKNVQLEIDHAIQHKKTIVPVWLEKETPLREGLTETQAVITSSFSTSMSSAIATQLMKGSARIQRQITNFKTNRAMNDQEIEGTKREIIGGREYLIIPLINSLYSSAVVIAEASTIPKQAKRIQLLVQNTGNIDYSMVRDAFKVILESDAEFTEEAEPLLGIYVTGIADSTNTKFHINDRNVAQYSDMIDTTNRAITILNKDATDKQTIQIFQKTLMEIAFLIGINMDRWLKLQVFKWSGEQYIQIMNVPPRIPN